VSTAPSQGAFSVEHLGEPQDPSLPATAYHCGHLSLLNSEGLAFIHEGADSSIYECIDSSPEFMSRGVLPRGSAGE
jgi:hypothetical protein